MNRYFRTAMQLHNLPVDCARELFKPSKDSASLQVCNDKKIWFWASGFFVSEVTSDVVF